MVPPTSLLLLLLAAASAPLAATQGFNYTSTCLVGQASAVAQRATVRSQKKKEGDDGPPRADARGHRSPRAPPPAAARSPCA